MKLNRMTVIATTSIIVGGVGFAQAQEGSDRSWWPNWLGMGQMMDRGYGPMMGQGQGRMMGRGHGPMMGFGYMQSTDRIDGRLAFIKAELKITAEQEEAWSEFAITLKTGSESHLESMQSMMESMHGGEYLEQSLPERLALHETHMAERIEQLSTVRIAVETLYEQLSDEQKQTADQIVMPMMGMGMPMGSGMMRR